MNSSRCSVVLAILAFPYSYQVLVSCARVHLLDYNTLMVFTEWHLQGYAGYACTYTIALQRLWIRKDDLL